LGDFGVTDPQEDLEATSEQTVPMAAAEDTSTPSGIEANGAATNQYEEVIAPPDDGEPGTISPEDYVSPADADDRDNIKPLEEVAGGDDAAKLEWYILKIQSNREETIREGLERRVKIAGLEKYFGDIIVPTELVTEFKGGKKKVVKRKLYPGYLVVHMEINEETWFLVRETPGIGDFTGTAGKPAPMPAADIAKIIQKAEEKTAEQPKIVLGFHPGDRVKIKEGTFENFEGDVDGIDEANGRVTVMINIFGRSTPVELEHWQIEKL
jgi:transcription termination/antitermination protein NusG